jgi:mono/diheme cytochrome c family protein
MKPSRVLAVACGVAFMPALLMAAGPQTITRYSGPTDYDVFCKACHGPAGKGDGTLAGSLRRRPADLTALAKKNDGVYPAEAVFKVVEKGHEKTDMPAWADVFAKAQESSGPGDASARIRELVKYLGTLQQKP